MSKLGKLIGRFGIGSSLLVAGAMSSACTTDMASDGDREAPALLASVTMANGDAVSFYEVAPAVIDIAQVAPREVTVLETAHRSAVDVFREAAPGQPVPDALLAAQARVAAARQGRPSHVASAANASGPIASITDTDFATRYCTTEGGAWTTVHCYTAPPLTGNHSGSAHDIDTFKVSACVNSGKINIKVWTDSDQVLNVDLLANFCSVHTWDSGFSNFDVVSDTLTVTASNTAYDLSTRWDN